MTKLKYKLVFDGTTPVEEIIKATEELKEGKERELSMLTSDFEIEVDIEITPIIYNERGIL